MKDKSRMIIESVIATLITVGTSAALADHHAKTPDTNSEKCYGIVKAGMNDCQTSNASCAGSATKDSQGDAFIFLPKGVCDKIVGGSLKPKTEKS